MKIYFTGFDSPILVGADFVSVLEVHNRPLFARICQSLATGLGTDALEPYTLWDDEDVALKSESQFLLVSTPINLPWDDRALTGGLASRFEQIVFEDESVRCEIEKAFGDLRSCISQQALQLNSDYTFGVDWDLKRYLKTYGFGVDLVEDEPLIDKLIKFIMLAKDSRLNKPLLFMNLKLFLSESELLRFYEQIFFARLPILLIEAVHDETLFAQEKKYVIDQDFIECW